MVKGKTPNSGRKAIREKEDVSRLVVRYAVTDRLSAVEEELHRRYVEKHGKLPLYTEYT